jgi:putative Mg2+ transporter-C (MgtC) family protein
MHAPTDLEFLLRVLLATGCGALIGLERQYRSRTAGLRTQALVAAGAASFVLFGEQAASANAPLQITAYVVSGVGFLGGGVILRQGFNVQGLNTAATLWCSAAVGCQAAGGHIIPALTLTGIVLGIHTVLRPLGRLLDRVPGTRDESVALYRLLVEVRRKHEPHLRARLLQAVDNPDITVHGLTGRNLDGDTEADMVALRVDMLIEGNAHTLLDGMVTRLSLEPGVRATTWQAEETATGSDDDEPAHRWSEPPAGRRIDRFFARVTQPPKADDAISRTRET